MNRVWRDDWTGSHIEVGPRIRQKAATGFIWQLLKRMLFILRCQWNSSVPPFFTSIKYSCQIYCVGTIDPLVLVTAAFWHALQHMSSRSGLNVEGFACFCTADICDSVEKVTDFTSETRRIYIYPPRQIDLIWQFNPLRDVLSVIKEKTSASRIPCVSKE